MNTENINGIHPESAKIVEIARELREIYSDKDSACIFIGVRDLGQQIESVAFAKIHSDMSKVKLIKLISSSPEFIELLKELVEVAEKFNDFKKERNISEGPQTTHIFKLD